MLLKEMYQAMYGKIDTRIGRAFAPITEVDDEQMIKYKDNDGESQEMKASSAKTMPMDHPAKVEYDKLAGGDDGVGEKDINIFDKPAEPKKDTKGREYDPKTGKGMGTDYRGELDDEEWFKSMMGGDEPDGPDDEEARAQAIADIEDEFGDEDEWDESIIHKGSFQEIKEQWVRDNLKVL